MTYWLLNVSFLGAAVVVALVALLTRRHRTTGRLRRTSFAISAAVLLVMTAIFDNVMIGVGLVGYDRAKISGIFVGVAPLEDFSYSVAALILLPSLWSLLSARPRTPVGARK